MEGLVRTKAMTVERLHAITECLLTTGGILEDYGIQAVISPRLWGCGTYSIAIIILSPRLIDSTTSRLYPKGSL
uniref:Amidase domain-containing protein n=1 Tax=Steinernema glaseri TaxID=37863 RepID=A0A1I7Y2I4_9BILA